MDQEIMKELKEAFCMDIYETLKAARKYRDEHAFRHTMFDEDGIMVFAGQFPKADLAEIPGVEEDFLEKLKAYSLVGIVADEEQGFDMFVLSTAGKPFTSLTDPHDLFKIIDDESFIGFMDMYFEARGVEGGISTKSYAEFQKLVHEQVFGDTPLDAMAQFEDALKS